MQARRERQRNMRRAIGEATRLGGQGGFRALPSRRTLILLLVIAVVGGFLLTRGGTSNSSPALATSCTTPAAAVGAVGNSEALRYSLTGPADATYVVTIDAATAKIDADTVDVTPAGAVAVAIKKGLQGCRADGALPSSLTGTHELVVFRDGKRVAAAKFPG